MWIESELGRAIMHWALRNGSHSRGEASWCAAPEILKGAMATYDGDASDVWSCAVVLLVSRPSLPHS